MNQLEQKTITSVEVAEMVGKDHNKLLRDIRNYIEQLNQSNLGHVEFFTESNYRDGKNETRPCYLVTIKGCEFIAHKMNGIKGTEFTAKYINKFHDMEDTIQNGILEGLSPELQAIFAHDKKLQFIVTHIEKTDSKVDSVDRDLQTFKQDMPILGIEESRITNAVRRKGVECLCGKKSNAYKNTSLRSKVYHDIYGQLKREFGVGSYKAIKRSQADMAVDFINGYRLPYDLQQQIDNENAQLSFGKEEIA